MTSFAYLDSPVGPLLLAGDDAGLRQIDFPKQGRPALPDPAWQEDSSALGGAISQLRAYFRGQLEEFQLPLVPQGTSFQQTVWTSSEGLLTARRSPTRS